MDGSRSHSLGRDKPTSVVKESKYCSMPNDRFLRLRALRSCECSMPFFTRSSGSCRCSISCFRSSICLSARKVSHLFLSISNVAWGLLSLISSLAAAMLFDIKHCNSRLRNFFLFFLRSSVIKKKRGKKSAYNFWVLYVWADILLGSSQLRCCIRAVFCAPIFTIVAYNHIIK